MIGRYTPKEMAQIWTDKAKFNAWLAVELAVINARIRMGEYPEGIHEKISVLAKDFSEDAVHARDKEIEHDMQAFVDVVRSLLPEELRHFFHENVTSYDIEEPALALQLESALVVIDRGLADLIHAVWYAASEHQWTFCMGITHSQDAEPTTYGWELCQILDGLISGQKNLRRLKESLKETKCSGAVGNYHKVSPLFEEIVLNFLDLKVRPASSQIVLRDNLARLLSEFAVIGSVIEKLATDIRLKSQSAVQEVREPRKAKQKGSTAMPHKRNPILSERMCGMSILLRAYAQAEKECIATWQERDIAHSSVERVIIPDAFAIFLYQVQKMTWIMEGLEVNREQMAKNIGRSQGTWASESVKTLLGQKGIEPDTVYRVVQKSAFRAIDQAKPFGICLLEADLPDGKKLGELVPYTELRPCFEFKSRLTEVLTQAYERFRLDTKSAFPPNIK